MMIFSRLQIRGAFFVLATFSRDFGMQHKPHKCIPNDAHCTDAYMCHKYANSHANYTL